jgi:hypothetical protein
MLKLKKRKVVTESAMTNFKSGEADIRALINRLLTNLKIFRLQAAMTTLEYERSDWSLILNSELVWRVAIALRSNLENMKVLLPVSDMSCNVHPYKPAALVFAFSNHSVEKSLKTKENISAFYCHFWTTTPPRLKSGMSPRTASQSLSSVLGKVVIKTHARFAPFGVAAATNA